MPDLISLAEVAAWSRMLEIKCTRCGRFGRYRLDRLMAKYKPDAGVRDVLPKLTQDCPKRNSPAIHERCDILFPTLAERFASPLNSLRQALFPCFGRPTC